MKLWKKILAGLAVVVTLFLIGGLLLPRQYDVARSVEIDAPPEKIYGPVSTLNEWPTWTVWNNDKYPDMTYSYDGAESGIGAKSSWTDPGAGNGRMEIVAADEQTGITYTLDFEGFSTAHGDIKFDPAPSGLTTVTMRMKGDLGGNPINRYFGLLMDGMMGEEFEQSLQQLKTRIESEPDPEPPTTPEDATARPAVDDAQEDSSTTPAPS